MVSVGKKRGAQARSHWSFNLFLLLAGRSAEPSLLVSSESGDGQKSDGALSGWLPAWPGGWVTLSSQKIKGQERLVAVPWQFLPQVIVNHLWRTLYQWVNLSILSWSIWEVLFAPNVRGSLGPTPWWFWRHYHLLRSPRQQNCLLAIPAYQ
jgi:hypothetical protein